MVALISRGVQPVWKAGCQEMVESGNQYLYLMTCYTARALLPACGEVP